MWSIEKLMDALGLELPIIQAPMAGANGSAMAAAVCARAAAGSTGLGDDRRGRGKRPPRLGDVGRPGPAPSLKGCRCISKAFPKLSKGIGP